MVRYNQNVPKRWMCVSIGYVIASSKNIFEFIGGQANSIMTTTGPSITLHRITKMWERIFWRPTLYLQCFASKNRFSHFGDAVQRDAWSSSRHNWVCLAANKFENVFGTRNHVANGNAHPSLWYVLVVSYHWMRLLPSRCRFVTVFVIACAPSPLV